MIAQQVIEPLATPEIAWSAIAPLVVLFSGALLLLTLAALSRATWPRGASTAITVITAVTAGGTALALDDRVTDVARGPFTAVAEALTIDTFSIFITVLVCVGVTLAALLSDDYLRREELDGPELHALLLLSALGGVVMGMANDLIVLFLGLETLSIALYVMAGFHLRKPESQESAMKYFVLGAFSSAFLLYGIALVYGATGSTNLSRINAYLAGTVLTSDGLLLAGFALLLVGLGFKISAVPFHTWTPDVYQGAPTPITAFMASASKTAAFAGLIRVFTLTFGLYEVDWTPIIWVLAVASLVVGSFLAIVQTDVKRMLAYSSIAHAGFILIGIEAATERGTQASLFYLLAYTFMIVGSFGIATVVGRTGDARHDLEDYRGLSKARPAMALAFAVFLLAQAGVPLTTGFLAKLYVIGAAAESHSYALAIIAMVSAVVSAFLYLRIIVAMYMDPPDADEPSGHIPVPFAAGLAIVLCVVFTVGAGIVPDPVVDWVKDAVPVLLAAPQNCHPLTLRGRVTRGEARVTRPRTLRVTPRELTRGRAQTGQSARLHRDAPQGARHSGVGGARRRLGAGDRRSDRGRGADCAVPGCVPPRRGAVHAGVAVAGSSAGGRARRTALAPGGRRPARRRQDSSREARCHRRARPPPDA